jgi:hypothetical protein
MRLIEELERRAAGETSMFQAQLLREDVSRLRRLKEMAGSLVREDFLEKGMRIGWTPGDARTAELREPLLAFLQAVYAGDEARIDECWLALHRTRMERLLGCLSTPVPRPAD